MATAERLDSDNSDNRAGQHDLDRNEAHKVRGKPTACRCINESMARISTGQQMSATRCMNGEDSGDHCMLRADLAT
jgi:hypothetical protein